MANVGIFTQLGEEKKMNKEYFLISFLFSF